jgi:hypothetical protein
VSFLIWLTLAQRLPDWAQRLLSADAGYGRKVQEFTNEVEPIHDEGLLINRLKVLCDSTFKLRAPTLWKARPLPIRSGLYSHIPVRASLKKRWYSATIEFGH